jgi:hypothetical protein
LSIVAWPKSQCFSFGKGGAVFFTAIVSIALF